MNLQSLHGLWQFRQAETDEWLPAQVPGSVHTDLLALDRIPEPFIADNELRVQWVAERDWEYRLTFQVFPDVLAEERVFLVCDGLDTLADLTLNGHSMGHAENMFRRYRWDVTTLLTDEENELRIRFRSPVAYIQARQEEQPLVSPSLSIPGGPHLRKAPCQFGWDWGPQLPPIGIWRGIRLEGYSTARLENVHLRQVHTGNRVKVSARATIERWQDADLGLTLRITSPDGQVQEAKALLKSDATTGTLDVEIAAPQLWWPNDYGPQPLYETEVTLHQGEKLRDRYDCHLGLRTLELRQEPDEFGTSFTFVINGVPIFAKGANWIPADSFPTRTSDTHLEHLIRSAAQAHMNMLRVWGGGLYEDERFYDLCDVYGILVWQDFIFSCSIYPIDESFFDNVCVEAVENIRRLRHRASLALWCGNNEMEWGWDTWGWDDPDYQPFKQAYDRMFHHLLPELCAEEDPDRPYWPSSPSSNAFFKEPNSVQAGDTHNWMVWHEGEPFISYRAHDSRFASEFGFQSLPALDTIRTYADESEWNMTSYIMEHHQRNTAGNGKIVTYLTDHFRLPHDFESLIYLSQLLQAEAVRIGVEHWRRNRHRTSGALYWQLNDCWPVASWASLDYFGRWKALQYAARRFYAPILLSAEDWTPAAMHIHDPTQALKNYQAHRESGLQVTLHVTNDLTDQWSGIVRWSLETLEGQRIETGEEAVTAPALSSVCVCELDFAEQVSAGNYRQVALVYELWQDDERISLGVVPCAPDKHLALTDPQLRCTVRENGASFEIEITAQRLARFVWLALEGADVVFSDNYFDLPAGRTASVILPAPEGWTTEHVLESLQVRSLTDSF